MQTIYEDEQGSVRVDHKLAVHLTRASTTEFADSFEWNPVGTIASDNDIKIEARARGGYPLAEISAKREISSNFARTMNNNSGVIHLSNNSGRPYGASVPLIHRGFW